MRILIAAVVIAALVVSAGCTKSQKDVVYGRAGGVELKLDYTRPAGEGPYPAVVCIHGGAWESGSKSGYGPAMKMLALKGYWAASVEYRFAPAHRFPAQLEDVQQALGYLRSHAGELRLDPKRMVLLGDSAGGHLALLAGMRDGSGGVRGIVNLAGPTDIPHWYAEPVAERMLKQTTDQLLQAVYGTTDRGSAILRDASPVAYVTAQAPPVLTFHGDKDPVVKVEQSIAFHRALRAARAREKLVIVPGAGHGFSESDIKMVVSGVSEFLAERLRPEARENR